MAKSPIKYGAQLAAKIEPDVMEKFVSNAEACKSTKDIVLRELVYAFNRYCEAEGGRFPVLQRIEVIAPGYIVNDAGKTEDASPGMVMLPDAGESAPKIVYPDTKSHAAKSPRKAPRSGAA